MKKNIKLFLLISCISVLPILSSCGVQGITGDEWVIMQMDYMDDIDAFTQEMDEVYTLYVSGGITAEDFLTELRLLKQQNQIMQQVYESEKEENTILPNSYSSIAQKGIQSIEDMRNIFTNILNESTDEDGNVLSQEEIAYLYLSYNDELETDLASYLVAYEYITGQYNIESESESSSSDTTDSEIISDVSSESETTAAAAEQTTTTITTTENIEY